VSRPYTVDAAERTLLGLALAFGGCGVLSLWMQTGSAAPAGAMAVLAAATVALHWLLSRIAPRRDPLLLPLAVLLCAVGALVVARVAPNFLLRWAFAVAVCAAVAGLIVAAPQILSRLRRLEYAWLAIAFALLIATLVLGVNPSGGSARLWLSLGSFFFQPSEMLRLLLVAFWSAFLAEPSHTRPPGAFASAVAMWLAAVGLLAAQQDFGAASLLLLSFVAMLYLATGRNGLPLGLVASFAAAGAVGYSLSSRVATRIDTWLNPNVDPQGRSFQIMQSLIAAASGGLFGNGLRQGSPGYVPAVHTDFPFVAVAEEFGLIGALVVVVVLALLCVRAWRIAAAGRSSFTRLLAGGIAASLAVQVFVIIGGNLALLPLTGVTLPFVSYGGSSLLAWMISLSLLLRLSADAAADRPPTHVVSRPMRRAMVVSLTAFGVLAAWTTVLMLWRAPQLVTRADNPRLLDEERAIHRGDIRARDGTVLAASTLVTVIDGRPVFSRTYPALLPTPDTAAVVGYYSLRYGTGSLENWADARLRGTRSAFDALLHRPHIGAPLTTTVDVRTHIEAAERLPPDAVGAAVAIDLRDGAVRALVSRPSFDAARLDAEWDAIRTARDAPLLNRATQALYQPGALLAWLYGASPQEFRWDPTDALGLARPISFELPLAQPVWPTESVSETLGQGDLRLTPLLVAFATARRYNPHLNAPTLVAEVAADPSRDLPAAPPTTTFRAAAQIGPNRHVLWTIVVDGYLVWVIAEERPGAEPLAASGNATAALTSPALRSVGKPPTAHRPAPCARPPSPAHTIRPPSCRRPT
jgi:peptidoglycan glycosyltransferase